MVKCMISVRVQNFNAEAGFVKLFALGFLPRPGDVFYINETALPVEFVTYDLDDDEAFVALKKIPSSSPDLTPPTETLQWLRDRNWLFVQRDCERAHGFKELQAEITRLKFEEQSDE